jgi:hypothetical protein
MSPITFKQVKYSISGNTRYVCHFLAFLTVEEKEAIPVTSLYRVACKRANKLGGRKYTGKAYGGGIVFQAMECRLAELVERINTLTGSNYSGFEVQP